VENPACNQGLGSEVAYGDGHVLVVPGVQLWQQAQQLMRLPAIATTGIAFAQWQVVPTTVASAAIPSGK